MSYSQTNTNGFYVLCPVYSVYVYIDKTVLTEVLQQKQSTNFLVWKKTHTTYKSILAVMPEHCILLNYGLICSEEDKDHSCDEIN